jgi:hypothetical protein
MSSDSAVQTAIGDAFSWSEPRARSTVLAHFRVVARTAAAALTIVVLQVALVSVVSIATAASQEAGVYDSFCRWDGNLYVQITERGYHGEPPGNPVDFQKSNVAFFPGYPLAARWLNDVSGGHLSYRVSMVLTAQLAAWGFWVYWLLTLRRLATPLVIAGVATLLLALHPASFFLVVAYSESLFLMLALGFLYWSIRGQTWAMPLAAAHGFAMTATRMGGVPVALSPLAAQTLLLFAPAASTTLKQALASGVPSLSAVRRAIRDGLARVWIARSALARTATLSAVALLGAITFFAYCQWAFGVWDLYMQTQKAGWNLSADWFWWARRLNYTFLASLQHPNVVWPDDLSRFTVFATLLAFFGLAGYERKLAGQGSSGWQRRLVFYLAAFGLFFLHAAGVSPILMKSMVRYSFGVHALLALAVVQLPAIAAKQSLSRKQTTWVLRLAGLLLLVQCDMLWRFFLNEWGA